MSRDGDTPVETDGGTVVDDADSGSGSIGGPIGEAYRSLRENEFSVVIGSALFLVVFPYLLIEGMGMLNESLGDPGIGGYEGLASLVLIYGIIVIGFNLLLGYTELLSFGHAAFFGTAAYSAALLSSTAEISFAGFSATMPGITSPIAMLVFGTALATLLAWPIGFMSIRRSGVYFAVLTLTFGQMLYFFALGPGSGITNGDNGFSDVNVGSLLGMVDFGEPVSQFGALYLPVIGNFEIPFLVSLDYVPIEYVFVAVLFLLALTVANRIVNSPYGLIFEALGENEQRVEFVGLNVFRYKLMAFIISGAFAGMGGALFVMHESFIHPATALYWIQSGDFVIMTVLGGTGSLIGPVFGAFIFEYIANVISGATIPVIGEIGSLWRLILGAVFVFIVWVFPRGAYGALVDLKKFLVRAVESLVWAVRNPSEAPGAFTDWLRGVGRGIATWLRGVGRGVTSRVRGMLSLVGVGGGS
ncbi:branched-chain amino acid ABC transporter permease [Salinirubellus salinus]|uniref:Branched-chain amino acid ABC transporter permease n=1 Tax=Salinirubellus salinus TaxID=1364945 RepID=A0A9E7R3T1_9EURY|nr:branched-chain amino acid ABC transporter permease [Salinirubellus salinus]UWM55296.1 branched-chain amino acid ABC transporter permease [Salinirubellus salinus]